MSEHYNQFTGQSIERLTALSDGLFAVAMTLLVLDRSSPQNRLADAFDQVVEPLIAEIT